MRQPSVTFVATLAIALAPMVAPGVTVTPSWETPEIVDAGAGSGTRGQRMQGQDRWLDFDLFGLAGVSVPGGSSEFGTSYRQRLPAAGWTPAPSITGGSTHATFAYDSAGLPVMVHVDSIDRQLQLAQVDPSRLRFSSAIIASGLDAPETDRVRSGASLAFDGQGRIAVVYVQDDTSTGRELTYLLDVDGDGEFDDDNFEAFALPVRFNGNLRPSLAFDHQSRPHIGTIATTNLAEPGPVEVLTMNPPTLFGSSMPDPDVDSTFVSLAINPTTGFPAVAYNDIAGRALKYAEWDGAAWNAVTVDTQSFITSVSNMPLSLAFDPTDGLPAIAYARDEAVGVIGQPPPADRLRFAWFDGVVWRDQAVDSTSSVAAGAVALAFNDASGSFNAGLPAIAYIGDDDVVRYVQDPPVLVELAGDYNRDGRVDASDYAMWRDTLSQGNLPPFSGADGDGNGAITFADYDIWQANFGATSSVIFLPSSDVPEPAAVLLALVAAISVGVVSRGATRCTSKSTA